VVTLCQLAVMAAILIFRKPLLAIFGQLGGGQHFTKLEHVGSSRFAEKTHQAVGAGRERLTERYPIPAFARRGRPGQAAEGAAGKADKAVKAAKAGKKVKTATNVAATTGKAAGGWVTLAAAAAMKGGQMAIRKGETAKRQLQGAASPFLLDGKAGAPQPRRMPEKMLGVDGRELRSYTWRRIQREPEPTPAVEEAPKAKPKRQKALPDGGPPLPRRSLPRVRWSRQPGGGHVLDVLRRKS
jgi:hypothetical protein